VARTRRRTPYDPSKAHDRRATESNRGVANHLTPIEVDDPWERGAKIVVVRSLRDDPLARLHARDQIDQAQYEAGKRYRLDWEKAERGPRAIDPSKEFVDGGCPPEPITDAQRKAVATLARLSPVLGLQTEHVLRRVLCGNLFPGQVAAELGYPTPKDAEHMAWLFRIGLETLAREYGFVSVRGC
jgi:hypothetical protein